MAEHVIDATRVHEHWDKALEPTLRIASGDVVDDDLAMAGRGQVERTGALKILETVDAGVWNVGFTLPLEVFTDDAEKN